MIKRMKHIFNKKGVTLIELLMSMLVMAIIMIAVTTVFIPMFRAYQRANNLAEVNTLLDNISTLVMNDVAGITDPPDLTPATVTLDDGTVLNRLFRLQATFFIDYYLDNAGIIWRSVQDMEPMPLLPHHFYKFWGAAGNETVFTVAACDLTFDPLTGTVELELAIESIDGWTRDRVYTARPLLLN